MNDYVTTGMFLLVICSAVTSLVTEGVKKLYPVKRPNVAAAIISVLIGVLVSVSWVIITETPVTGVVCVFIIAVVILSWLVAMVGYDKVIQTISQIKGGKDSDVQDNGK